MMSLPAPPSRVSLPRAAIQIVVFRRRRTVVVARTAIGIIISVAARQHIVAAAAVQIVVSAQAVDRVVPGQTVDQVTRRRPVDQVRPRRSVDVALGRRRHARRARKPNISAVNDPMRTSSSSSELPLPKSMKVSSPRSRGCATARICDSDVIPSVASSSMRSPARKSAIMFVPQTGPEHVCALTAVRSSAPAPPSACRCRGRRTDCRCPHRRTAGHCPRRPSVHRCLQAPTRCRSAEAIDFFPSVGAGNRVGSTVALNLADHVWPFCVSIYRRGQPGESPPPR